MKVLIADDEAKVCKLIRYLIDWEAMGFEIVDIVNDGMSAYNSICQNQPDIVITDIRMPNYDGLELVKKSKELYPDIYFIIISGYSHFEYAQQAIKYGVQDYLLKPLKKKELQETLRNIKVDYESKLSETLRHEELCSIADNNRKQMKQNFLKQIVEHGVKDSDTYEYTIDAANSEFGCNFEEGWFQIYLLRPYIKDKDKEIQAVEFLLLKIQQTLIEKMESYCLEILSVVHNGAVVLLLNLKDPIEEEAEKSFKKLKITMSNAYEMFDEVELVMARGNSYRDVVMAGKSYQEALSALKGRMGKINGSILSCEDIFESGKRSSEYIDMNARNDIIACQERMDKDGIIHKIEMVEKSLSPYGADGALVYECFCELVETLLFGMKNYGDEFESGELTEYKSVFEESYSYAELFSWLKDEIQKRYEIYAEKKRITESKPIRDAKQYIYDNFNNNLSLDNVSEVVGFNPAYFSTLFKKETGKNFSEYLTELRIQNAKTYLIQTGYEIAEVARFVGYGDLKYFSKLFKKETGLNPSEFRKLYG